MRVGEADNPGPFSVISANVTSFLPHLNYLASLDFDVLGMQEVRLTEDAIKVADDTLTDYGVKSLWGKPQPIRRGTLLSTMDAKQGGVGFLYSNKHAIAPSPRTETGEKLWESGRWQSVAVRINSSGLVIHVVTIYGHPRANEGGDVMDTNEELLRNIFDEAGSLGNVPILVVGDYNVKPENSPFLSNLITSGLWVDIGQTTATLAGKLPDATYEARGVSSRIDLAFGNSELMRYLKGYEVLSVPHDGIKSHKPIKIVFEFKCPKAFALQTRKVKNFPKVDQNLHPEDLESLEFDIFSRYIESFERAVVSQDVNSIWDAWSSLAESFLCERTALETGDSIYAQSRRYRGRGHAAATHQVRLGNQGRHYEGVELDPERRNVRKLHNILKEMVQARPTMPEELYRHLWSKACRIGKECIKGQIASFSCLDPPTTDTIQGILVETEQLLENIIVGGRKRLIKNWKERRSNRIKANIGELFKQFRPLDQVPLAILKRSDGSITGDVAEMDKILRANWMPIFAKHESELHPEPDVQAFLTRFGHLIPEAKQKLAALTVNDLVSAVQKFASDGAGGLDGWKPLDLKRLTKPILGLLLHLFDAIESQGVWPDDLCWAGITLIPKGEGGMPLDLRPITVTPLVYRIWAAARTQQSMLWQEEWIHPGQHGARMKHSTSDALINISLSLEESIINGTNIQGIAVDLAKAFDNVPVGITFAILEKLGMDSKLVKSLRGMYQQINRRFKLGQYVGEAFASTNGILQGCPISVMLLNAIMMVLHRAIGSDLVAESFVDDLTLLSLDAKELQKAVDTIAEFMALTDQKVNTKKTKSFGMQPGVDILYDGKPLERAQSVKVLGATWIFREGFFELGIDDKKIDNLCSMAHRIRCSGLAFHQRELLCSALIMAKVLYATEVVDLDAAQERKLRTAIGYAIWAKADKSRNPGLLFTLPIKGHTTDPAQAPFVRRLNGLHRVTKDNPALLARVSFVLRAKAKQRRMRRGGFAENLLYTFQRLGLAFSNNGTFEIQFGGIARNPSSTPAAIWGHDAREAARKAVWRTLDKERARGGGTALGIGGGIHVKNTMALYHKSDPMKKGILRKILLGGIWTKARLSHLPNPPCTADCDCGHGRETLRHLWWECTRWDSCRLHFADKISMLDLENLAIATRELGIYLASDTDEDPWIQELMVVIFKKRYEGF